MLKKRFKEKGVKVILVGFLCGNGNVHLYAYSGGYGGYSGHTGRGPNGKYSI
ncbi:hypothetical protein ACFY4F_15890 [Peribacillus butanolivorans]|uniref:hypothetical protein n=1 Tax=Peribacillus butanolivorans TaxID=421767 RepID=UPI00367B5289